MPHPSSRPADIQSSLIKKKKSEANRKKALENSSMVMCLVGLFPTITCEIDPVIVPETRHRGDK